MNDAKNNRQDIFDKVISILEKNNIKYVMTKDSKKKFINNEVNMYGEAPLILSLYDADSMKQITSLINKDIAKLGGHAKRDTYNTLYVYYDKSLLVKPDESDTIEEASNELTLPEDDSIELGITPLEVILNKTDKKRIFLTSDWHFFKNHYKHEANYVNTKKILTWCRQNIKDNDVFMYLGDISFRYANDEDKKESARLLSTIPGIKVLILGNHDMMAGDEYFTSCGFHYIYQEYEWNNLVFTHRPINMMLYPPEYLNIHGHIHNIRSYNTCDGKRNINVYPLWYDGKPATLDYILNHVEELTKFNFWNKNYGYDEGGILNPNDTSKINEIKELEQKIAIQEDIKDLEDARKFVTDVSKLAKKYDANYFIVTDGASGYSNGNGKSNPAVKNAREAQVKWEKKHGFDPNEDWSNSISEAKRGDLPDNVFGIPEDRKYPLDSKKHVQSAIKLFGHADEDKKKSLAKRIKDAAKQYDVTIPENTQCYKYLNEGGIDDIIPADVNTIIFDMGSVLVDSNTHNTILTGLHVEEHVAHIIADYVEDILFYNEKELEYYTIDEAKKYFIERVPDNVARLTDQIFDLFLPSLFTFSYVDELLLTLKAKGYSIYYLSNWPKWSYDLEKSFFDKLTKKFDGGLFSCHGAYMKPNKKFYLQLIEKYNLDPTTCFFFDDKAENINAGTEVGIRGYLFDCNETPKLLLSNNFVAPANVNNQIMVNKGLTLEAVDLSKINWWYCSDNIRDTSTPDDGLFYDSIDDAVKDTASEISDVTKKYLYFRNSDEDTMLIPVGQISINPDGTYEWIAQYPLTQVDGKFVINEYSMAAVNPIIGVTKPFILQLGLNNSIISPKQYALSPDIVSDKYLVVDENAKLKIVNESILEDRSVTIYEFIGNKARIGKLAEAYLTGKTVDNTIFYTALTGKPMLCEDQIEFDTENFRKVNMEQMIENSITEMATTANGYLEAIGYGACWTSVLESAYVEQIDFLPKYNKNNDISVREDFNGYYLYSELTKKRTRSVATVSMITEEMIISII